MIVSRRAPVNNCLFEPLKELDAVPSNVTYKTDLQTKPHHRIVVDLPASNGDNDDNKNDRHRVEISIAEVVLLFATIPREQIALAVFQYFKSINEFQRDDPDGPHCAINPKEFADKLIEFLRFTVDGMT